MLVCIAAIIFLIRKFSNTQVNKSKQTQAHSSIRKRIFSLPGDVRLSAWYY